MSIYVPACEFCNSSKWAHDPIDWYTRQAFFLGEKLQRILEILEKS